jgi:hypothetical protein
VSLRPAYAYGPPTAKVKAPVFQCPVSAIPSVVWDLFEDWWACRLMGTLPLAGGWADQPLLVRRAFPVFEALMRTEEQRPAPLR